MKNTPDVENISNKKLNKNQTSNKQYLQHQQLNYPEHIPPENILMAIEYFYTQENQEKRMPERTCWMYVKGEWLSMTGSVIPYRVYTANKTIRFKPW